MNMKQIIGLVVLVIGIVLLCYGFYGASRMSKARGDIDTATSYIPENRSKGFVSDALHGEVDKYKLPVTLCFVGGVIFIVGGGAMLYMGRKK